MKKEKVFLYYVTGEKEEVIVLVQRIQRDHHRFNGTTAQKVPELFVFHHDQHHTRLDLSELEDHLLLSFDKDKNRVGLTYCKRHDGGPFALHNKQRIFLVIPRNGMKAIEEIQRFEN
jgi:hypothetical protein